MVNLSIKTQFQASDDIVPGFVDTIVGCAPSSYPSCPSYSEYTPNNPSLSSLGAGADSFSSDNFTPTLASTDITHNFQPDREHEAVLLDLDQDQSVIDIEGEDEIRSDEKQLDFIFSLGYSSSIRPLSPLLESQFLPNSTVADNLDPKSFLTPITNSPEAAPVVFTITPLVRLDQEEHQEPDSTTLDCSLGKHINDAQYLM